MMIFFKKFAKEFFYKYFIEFSMIKNMRVEEILIKLDNACNK